MVITGQHITHHLDILYKPLQKSYGFCRTKEGGPWLKKVLEELLARANSLPRSLHFGQVLQFAASLDRSSLSSPAQYPCLCC